MVAIRESTPSGSVVGRFAPSPTGPLHLGSLRTALLAWLSARSRGGAFLVRFEDLDQATSSPRWAEEQLADLAAIGLDWDGTPVVQSERFDRYDRAIDALHDAGLTYECFCTRREIQEAASAPHGPSPEGAYPGTCRDLTAAARARRRRERPPAVRLRSDHQEVTFVDRVAGPSRGLVDDVVIRRNDGVPAYNLVVVVDDAAQGVTEVVRGDDLLPSVPRQIHLARLLGLAVPEYGHVPLVRGPDGVRLAKRHGAITLAAVRAGGASDRDVLRALARSCGLPAHDELESPRELIADFELARMHAATSGVAPYI